MFGNIYNKKKVLITGNTGFKGSWLSMWLLKLGAKVYGLSKDVPTDPSMYKELDLINQIDHYEKDVRDLDSAIKIVKDVKPDFVFHLAAQALVSVSYANPIETMTTNIIGTTNILEALKLSNHPCVGVFITSDKCYDNVEWEWGYKETDALGGRDIYSGSKGVLTEIVFKSYFHSFLIQINQMLKLPQQGLEMLLEVVIGHSIVLCLIACALGAKNKSWRSEVLKLQDLGNMFLSH